MLESILILLLIGAVIGWLAGLIVKGGGFGLIGDIVVGILGSMLGGWLLPRLGVAFGTTLLGSIATGVIGAVILLVLIRLIRRV